MVNIKIHRGTSQIGGTITEIYTENTHIFIDFGSELTVNPEESTDNKMIEMIKNILLPVANAYDTHIVIIIIAFLFIVFLELANAIQSGYTGIILGNIRNNNKVAFSVIYGFITYILTQLSIIAVVFIFGLFNKDIMNLFHTTEFISVDIIKTLIYLAIAIYITTLIILYLINIKLFKQGVNVD